jgi:threonine aldolase
MSAGAPIPCDRFAGIDAAPSPGGWATVVPGCQFASDNTAGLCPEAWEAVQRAGRGCAASYGDDPWTKLACDRIREIFECDADVFFVFNGTAANSLALASMCQSYHAILCHELAHVETDECGAPEFFSNGTKVLLAGGADAKLTPGAVHEAATRRRDIHYPKPRVVSLTQATELSTVYAPEEIANLAEACRSQGLGLHMDGARFANAVAALAVPPRRITWEAGVDVLCLGGTKNGIGFGEAVVFFRRSLAEEFAYRCKQAGQLASKMRFLSAPWVGALEDGAWLRHAAHANRSAERLERRLADIHGVELIGRRQANAIFLRLPPGVAEAVRGRGWRFYDFIGAGGSRLMCSWATTDADIDALVADIREAVG